MGLCPISHSIADNNVFLSLSVWQYGSMADGKPVACMLQIQWTLIFLASIPNSQERIWLAKYSRCSWCPVPRLLGTSWTSAVAVDISYEPRCLPTSKLSQLQYFCLRAFPKAPRSSISLHTGTGWLCKVDMGDLSLPGETPNLQKTGVSPAFCPLEGRFWGVFYMLPPRAPSGIGNHSSNQFNNTLCFPSFPVSLLPALLLWLGLPPTWIICTEILVSGYASGKHKLSYPMWVRWPLPDQSSLAETWLPRAYPRVWGWVERRSWQNFPARLAKGVPYTHWMLGWTSA